MSEPKAEPSQKPFLERYAIVIALVAVAIGVPSLVINCITLYQWSTDASGPVLTVSARANAFAIPPTPPIPNGYDPAEMFGEYKTYVTLTLKNTGDLPADNVRVVLPRFGDLPANGRFQYERSDGAASEDSFVSEFDIGTVEADQLIDVSFWTSEELGESDVLTLSSKSGKEYVQLGEKDSVLDFVPFPSIVSMLAVVVALFYFDKRRNVERRRERIAWEAEFKESMDRMSKLDPARFPSYLAKLQSESEGGTSPGPD